MFLLLRNFSAILPAISGDIVEPTIAIKIWVLCGAKVSKNGKLRICKRIARIRNAGELRIMGADRVSKGNKVFLSHFRGGFEF